MSSSGKKHLCSGFPRVLCFRQGQVQRGPAEGRRAAAADPKAGRDPGFSGGRR